MGRVSGKLRIIGGQWRSRIIQFEDAPGLRPTSGRLRETLFNWLQYDVPGSRCLDLFAGSGALGFEAASRGAQAVLMVESNPRTVEWLKRGVAQLQTHCIEIKNQKAEDFLLTNSIQTFDLVFMDPPFDLDMANKMIWLLADSERLAVGAKIYVEISKQQTLKSLPEKWNLIKQSKAGDVVCYLYQNG